MVSLLFYMKSGARAMPVRPRECWWGAPLSVYSIRCVWLRGVSWSGVAAQTRGRDVMQGGSHVESGLANGKWVTPSWAESATWPWHYYLPHCVYVLTPAVLAWWVPIIQSCQMNHAHRMAIAFYYEDKNTMHCQWQVQAFALSSHLPPPLDIMSTGGWSNHMKYHRFHVKARPLWLQRVISLL